MKDIHKLTIQKTKDYKMTLNVWVQKVGPKKAAQLIGVDVSAISKWKTFKACPKPHHMIKIVKATKGQVTYKNLIENFVNAQR